MPSAALPGGWRTRWHCGVLWASARTRTRRTIPRSRARRRLIDAGHRIAKYSTGCWEYWRIAALLKGQRIAIDATTLEANAAMRSIVRRDTGRELRRVSAAD